MVVFLLLVAGILFNAAAQTKPAPDGPAPGSISGVVKDAATGSPLADYRVNAIAVNGILSAGAGSKRLTTVTDGQGRYRFNDLPPGRYLVSAIKLPRGPSRSRFVNLSAGEALSSIDVAVETFVAISGRVFDENKEPVAGGRILLISREYQGGLLRYIVGDSATTDDRGEYVLQRVKPGRPYWVMADKSSEPVRPISDAPADPKFRKAVLAATYYSNSDVIEGAMALILYPGERREGVDIRMSRKASYCVEGVLNAGGGPAVLDFSIRQQSPAGVEMPAFQRGGRTGPNGKIRICGLPAGQYTLRADTKITTH